MCHGYPQLRMIKEKSKLLIHIILKCRIDQRYRKGAFINDGIPCNGDQQMVKCGGSLHCTNMSALIGNVNFVIVKCKDALYYLVLLLVP